MVKDHIHLSETLGGAPENAPDIKWKVKNEGWIPKPTVVETHRRTITGKLNKHVLRKGDGSPAQFMDWRFVVRIDDYDGLTAEQRWTTLLGLQGKVVYLVDNYDHPDDGTDHTSNVRQMYFSGIADIKPLDPLLNTMFVTIELVDDYTI